MKTALVMKHELTTQLRKPGYLLMAFGLPIVGLLVLAGIKLVNSESAPQLNDREPQVLEPEGYVDHSGLIRELPRELPRGTLVEFPTEVDAQRALSTGSISAYYVIPADHLQSGQLTYVHPSLNPLSEDHQDWVIRRTLLLNLLGGDEEKAEFTLNPVTLQKTDLSAIEAGASGACTRPGMDCEANRLVFYMPMIVMVFFFVLLTNGSSLLIRGVSGEKQNRLIEILASSLSPRQLMTGKILGLGIASLLAFAAWVLAAFTALRLGQPSLPLEFDIPGSFLPWAVIFFLLGFALYASLMAGIGALVPNVKDTTKAAWIVMGPMMVGYLVGIFSMEQAHTPLMVVLSLVPITSPLNMVQRLSTGGVPGWQPPLAAVLLVFGVVLALRFAGRLFRAHHLLSGQPFSIGSLVTALRS